MSAQDDLERIFDAERTIRNTERQLLASSLEPLEEALSQAVREAMAQTQPEEAELRLERLADLCAQVHGPSMVDALLTILNHDAPSVRQAAGEALLDVAYERYAEVARGIERLLDADGRGPAMSELPFVLAEVGEPSALPLIRRFLSHDDPDVVAAAIEALAQLGDPEAAEDLRRFVDDTREVTLEDFEDETTTTLAELAREAIDLLTPER